MGDAGRSQPLDVRVVLGVLTIRIGVDILAHATRFAPGLEHYDEATTEFYEPKVTDAELFATEVARALRAEEEDGTTPVHRMLDKAAIAAIENGAEGIVTGQDQALAARVARATIEAAARALQSGTSGERD